MSSKENKPMSLCVPPAWLFICTLFHEIWFRSWRSSHIWWNKIKRNLRPSYMGRDGPPTVYCDDQTESSQTAAVHQLVPRGSCRFSCALFSKRTTNQQAVFTTVHTTGCTPLVQLQITRSTTRLHFRLGKRYIQQSYKFSEIEVTSHGERSESVCV